MRFIITLIFIVGFGFLAQSQRDVRPMITVLGPTITGADSADFRQLPEFPGGNDSLRKYVFANLRYPYICREMGIEGNVYVRFTVSTDTTISGLEIARGVERNLDKEVMRVFKKMPVWLPATDQNDSPTSVQILVPIKFRLW